MRDTLAKLQDVSEEIRTDISRLLIGINATAGAALLAAVCHPLWLAFTAYATAYSTAVAYALKEAVSKRGAAHMLIGSYGKVIEEDLADRASGDLCLRQELEDAGIDYRDLMS
jgi:hypothetical protein